MDEVWVDASEDPGALALSCVTREGVDALMRGIDDTLASLDEPVRCLLPFERGDLVAEIHATGAVAAVDHVPEGTRVDARVPAALAAKLREFAVRG